MMNIWIVTTVLLLSSTYLVTGQFQGDPYSTDGCGETRGCFDCRDSLATCAVNVAWEPNPQEGVVKFTLWGTKVADLAHVSVGITATQDMASADVYSCISDDTGMVMGRSWNPANGRTTIARTLKGVSGQEVSEVGDMIRCQFNRMMSLDDGDVEFFDVTNISYFLILSAGNAAGGEVQGHTGSNRGVSALVDLTQTFLVEPNISTQEPAASQTQEPAASQTQQPVDQGPYSTEGCGETRGCFDCRTNLATCEVNVAWEPNPQEGVVKFTLWGTKVADQAHVSVGITLTANMFNADVYSCISDDTGLVVGRSWNPATDPRTTEARTLKGVSGQEVSEVGNMIRCQFNRVMSLDDGDDEFFDINNISYFLILSAGSAAGGAGRGHTGGSNRGLSASVDLSQTFSVGAGESSAYLMKLHGCLMIIAWIGLASVGLTMARFFKPMWPDSKLCDVKIWFAVHRACMVLALLLFVTGFIVIFVHVGGFLALGDGPESRRRFSHAVLGVIVTALGVINPIMAIFRPHPGTPNRSIFNWAHWAVGTSALILSFVTIGLALVPIAGINILPNLQGYTFWVLIGFCVFMFVMWVIFEVLRCSTDSEGRTDDIPLSDKNDTVQAADDTGPSGSMLKTILLFIFSLGAVFATAFLIITIAIA